MEIVARPTQRRRGTLLVRGLVVLALLVVVLLLTPAALGLERQVVRDDAMAGSLPRGSLVFGDGVPVQELRVGDVITFRSPLDPGRLVTRRIVDLSDGLAVTRGDARAAADPWLLPLDDEPSRVAVAIPWLGYPWLLLTGAGPFAWVLTGTGAAAAVLGRRLLRRRSRRPSREPGPLTAEGVRTSDVATVLR